MALIDSRPDKQISNGDHVSLVGLKELAEKHLKKDSPLRSLLMSEPDFLPRQEYLVKAPMFAKLLRDELGSEPD